MLHATDVHWPCHCHLGSNQPTATRMTELTPTRITHALTTHRVLRVMARAGADGHRQRLGRRAALDAIVPWEHTGSWRAAASPVVLKDKSHDMFLLRRAVSAELMLVFLMLPTPIHNYLSIKLLQLETLLAFDSLPAVLYTQVRDLYKLVKQ